MLTIGVDAHKAILVAVAVDGTGRECASTSVPTTEDGIAQLMAWASSLQPSDKQRWGIEGSGSYGRRLAQTLVRRHITVVEVPGIATATERRRSRGRQREKSDGTDALAIARVTLRDATVLPPVQCEGPAYQCKLLTEHRDNLVLARTRALNQLYAHIDHAAPVARAAFRSVRGRALLARLASTAPTATDAIAFARESVVHQLAQLVQSLDSMIASLDAQLIALAGVVAPALLQLTGVGALTAAKVLAEAGDVARFATAAKFAAYAGVAPLEASSGTHRRHRLSRRGNRQLNGAIHIVAVTQRRWHPSAQAFLARKLADGKTRKEALRGLKRHLANVIYRALKLDAQQVGRPPLLTAA
jgi:transposase